MPEIDLNDPSFKPENEEPQRRRGRPPKAKPIPLTVVTDDGSDPAFRVDDKAQRAPAYYKQLEENAAVTHEEVLIVCITTARPWTHERPLNHGEKAMVPLEVAENLVANGHAVIV